MKAHSTTVLLRRAIQLSFGKVTRCLTVAEFGGNATLPRNLAPNITSWYASGCAEPLFQAQAPWRILNDSQLTEPACVKPFPFIQNSTHLVLDPGTYLLTENTLSLIVFCLKVVDQLSSALAMLTWSSWEMRQLSR